MLNMERLRALLAVREHGSVAAAARALHVTPSGVSQQLGKLERETGHTLSRRHGRGVRLTDAGVVLAGHAARVLAGLDAAEADLADLQHEVLGPLRIGSLGSSIRVLVAPALERLVAAYPRVTPSLVDGESVDLLPRLHDGELDLVLGERWPSRPSTLPAAVHAETLFTEPVGVALSARHPLAEHTLLDLADLGELPWVACPSDLRDALVAAFAGRHIVPRIDYQVTEFTLQLALVRAGLAAALMPAVSIGPVPDGVVVRPLRPTLHREVYVAWRAESDRPVTRACVEALRAVVPAEDHAELRTAATG